MVASGLPGALADGILTAHQSWVAQPERVTTTVAELTGRPALGFRHWAADHVADFRYASPGVLVARAEDMGWVRLVSCYTGGRRQGEGGAMGYYQTTDGQPARDRMDYWRELVNDAFVPKEPSPHPDLLATSFRGSLAVDPLGEAQFVTVLASAQQVRRGRRLVSSTNDEACTLFVPINGSARIRQDRHTDKIGVGDLMLLDSCEPYQLVFDSSHRVVCVNFPRRMLPVRRDLLCQLTGARLDAKDGAGALLRSFTVQLATQLHGRQLSSAVAFRLADTLTDLTETLVLERLGELRASAGRPARALLLAIKRDIETRLGQPTLAPPELAARHHISLRYLHRLFESEGVTVAEWIRRRRLDRCGRDMRDPALAFLPVAAIGARWGMRDSAHFTRTFKASYGVTPGAYRRQALAAAKADLGARRLPG